MNIYGPNISEKYSYNKALIKFIDDCTKYVSKLPDFSKYCVWRYTIGSASINTLLIFNKVSDNSPYWTYLFFRYWNNTYFKSGSVVPQPFTKWKDYFTNPDSFNKLPKDKQIKIAGGIINEYIKLLQQIILKAPKTSDSFKVYKVSSKYPALPDATIDKNELPIGVLQQPFNSVTITPNFNFAPFISPIADCCLFNIEIPKGSSCLYVSPDYHAYPFEHEIILPFNCIFVVNDIKREILNYINKDIVNIEAVQDINKIRMGPVYTVNQYFPCGNGQCVIWQKPFVTYYCNYSNP